VAIQFFAEISEFFAAPGHIVLYWVWRNCHISKSGRRMPKRRREASNIAHEAVIMPPQSKKYRFTSLISENRLCQSWQASDLSNGSVYYVKTPNPKQVLDLHTANQILADSFANQRLIKTPKVLTANARRNEDGVLFIEYPFLDSREWQGLTPDHLAARPVEILLQISLITDYLHLLGLVHGDLKLSNFMIRNTDGNPALMLVDLDFLSEAHRHPGAQVFGTPGHIPPEVESNQIVVPHSDNYSLGVSLQLALEKQPLSVRAKDDGHLVDGLDRLVDHLRTREWSDRPRFLTTALRDEKIIDETAFEMSQRTLLGMKLLGDFRLSQRRQFGRQNLPRNLMSARNRVMGLSNELLKDMAAAFGANRLTTFRFARRFLDEIRIERFGEYWHLIPEDRQLRNAFVVFQNIAGGGSGIVTDDNRDRRTPEQLIDEAVSLKDKGCLQKALFTLEDCLSRLDRDGAAPDDQRRVRALEEQVEICSGLNRLSDASKYCDSLLKGLPADSEAYLNCLYESTLLCGSTGDTARMKAQVEKGHELATHLGNREQQLKFSRLTAWQLSLNGKHDEADAMLAPLFETAQDEGWFAQAVLIQYTRGVLEWRRGDCVKSEKRLLEALRLAKANKHPDAANPVLVWLTQLYGELAEYDKSVKYGKLAIQKATSPKDTARLPVVYPPLMFGCIRLGEHKKAEYWLQRFLNLQFVSDNSVRLVAYLHNLGFLKINTGDLVAARESFTQAVAISSPNITHKNRAKMQLSLAEIALFRGEEDRCKTHVDQASRFADAARDKPIQAEVELTRALCHYYYSGNGSVYDLADCLRPLIDGNCRYYTALCLLHLLTGPGSSALREEVLGAARPFVAQFERSKSPLLNAAADVFRFAEQRIDDPLERLRLLKSVYRVVGGMGQRFLSLAVCRQLARHYEAAAENKLAEKFYLNSLKIAEALGNESMERSIREHIETLASDEGNRERLIDSIHGISETIGSFDDYDEALLRMVKFAVEQTGAERGALLLKKTDRSELQVASYLHCDEDSLSDIQNISSRIPRDALAESQPIIIENALTDKRTREYQSIVYHNILSVACLPIVKDGEQMGALYLDHHTIPALFDEADIVYMKAIANFLSVLLDVAQRHRTTRSMHQQLLSDLSRVGVADSFITEDPMMKKLLNGLPVIAASPSPILITGESGTGKEILARLSHKLSPRAERPFISINCSAIPRDLIEAELFGIGKNVATGVDAREGKFSAADGGTLLLDEIGEMAMEVQAKLLRVVEDQRFCKVGSNRAISVDVRLLYSTNKNLREAVKRGEFRRDLYHRITTFVIEIPPLHNRRGDIPLLVEHFIGIFAKGKQPPRFSAEAHRCLAGYDWPGNVRELKNVIERLCIIHPGVLIDETLLPDELQIDSSDLKLAGQEAEVAEKAEMLRLLLKHDWNISAAAREMDMPYTTFRNKMRRFGIRRPR